MSSNEKRKDKKKRLGSLLLMLFLTIILLTTSTYAWFTSNRNVQIANIDVNVTAADGIQISTDAENWKTVVSNADILKGYPGDTNMWSGVMSPVSTIKLPNSDGKLDMYLGEVKSDENDTTEAGRFELTATNIYANETHSNETTGNHHYIVFDVFLKLDKASDVYLGIGSGVSAIDDDKGIKNAARIAFLKGGNGLATASVTSLQNLGYATSADRITIIEPNADVHTSAGIIQAQTYYANYSGVASIQGTGSATISYDGVKTNITAANNIPLINTNATDNPNFFATVTTVAQPVSFRTDTAGNNYLLFPNLEDGVTKVRVYLWVEGQDVDCENAASGDDITFTIKLSLDATTGM